MVFTLSTNVIYLRNFFSSRCNVQGKNGFYYNLVKEKTHANSYVPLPCVCVCDFAYVWQSFSFWISCAFLPKAGTASLSSSSSSLLLLLLLSSEWITHILEQNLHIHTHTHCVSLLPFSCPSNFTHAQTYSLIHSLIRILSSESDAKQLSALLCCCWCCHITLLVRTFCTVVCTPWNWKVSKSQLAYADAGSACCFNGCSLLFSIILFLTHSLTLFPPSSSLYFLQFFFWYICLGICFSKHFLTRTHTRSLTFIHVSSVFIVQEVMLILCKNQ